MKGMMKATLQRQSTQNGNLPGKPFEKFGMEAYKGLPHTNSSGSKSLGYSGSTDVEDFELEDCRRQHILLSRLSSLSIGSHIESECDFLESSLDSDVRSCSAPVKLTSKPSLSLIDTSTETTNTFESITPLDSPYDLDDTSSSRGSPCLVCEVPFSTKSTIQRSYSLRVRLNNPAIPISPTDSAGNNFCGIPHEMMHKSFFKDDEFLITTTSTY